MSPVSSNGRIGQGGEERFKRGRGYRRGRTGKIDFENEGFDSIPGGE